MADYVLTLAAGQSAGGLPDGAESVTISAASEADARAYAKAAFPNMNRAHWDNCTVTAASNGAIADILNAPNLGSVYVRIRGAAIQNGSTQPVEIAVNVPWDPSTTTIDLFGAKFDAALTAAITGGAAGDVTYSTRVITIVGANKAFGDATIVAEFRINGVAIPGLAPVVNSAGSASSDRTITLPNIPTTLIPKLLATAASAI